MKHLSITYSASRTEGWQQTKAFLQSRLQQLREQNDNHSEPEATASIRGQIQLIKEMLKADMESPKFTPMADHTS